MQYSNSDVYLVLYESKIDKLALVIQFWKTHKEEQVSFSPIP